MLDRIWTLKCNLNHQLLKEILTQITWLCIVDFKESKNSQNPLLSSKDYPICDYSPFMIFCLQNSQKYKNFANKTSVQQKKFLTANENIQAQILIQHTKVLCVFFSFSHLFEHCACRNFFLYFCIYFLLLLFAKCSFL